jgi:hypothetical protein
VTRAGKAGLAERSGEEGADPGWGELGGDEGGRSVMTWISPCRVVNDLALCSAGLVYEQRNRRQLYWKERR